MMTFLLLIALLPWNQEPALTQGAETESGLLTPEQTLNRRSLSDLQLSPDGQRVAFTVGEPVKGPERNQNIWVLEVAGREIRQYTTSEKSDTSPRWSPDNQSIAFLSRRSGSSQIYLIALEGGEARALTEEEEGIQRFAWSPDGSQIAFLAEESKTEDEKKKETEKDDARREDLDDRIARLWILDLESKKTTQITRGNWRISEFVWARTGERLFVSATEDPQPELMTDRIYSVDIKEGKMQVIAGPERPFGNLKLSPTGSHIAYLGTRGDGPVPFDLYVLPLNGGPVRNMTGAALDRSIGGFDWIGASNLLISCATGFSGEFHRFSLQGVSKALSKLDISPAGPFVQARDGVVFIGESATRLPELFIRSETGTVEQITDLNKDWDDVPLLPLEIFTYPGFDGIKIEAALLKPADTKPRARLPLIVLVHGGPTGRWSERFEPWGQLLAARGFAVFYPNIRGSTGYGHDFLAMNRRDWGGGDFRDVLAGVDFLVDRGVADPERLGIGGWSYGGYMAAWAVTQTDRFKASVSGAPMTDLEFEYGTENSGINAYDTWFMGTPYENQDLFADRSPTTHLKNVTTPTLILCGENDVIDPIGQSRQFHRGLKRYGVETEFVRYPREGHGIREEKHQIDLLNRVIEWFEKYVE